jgi:hypothetical protein
MAEGSGRRGARRAAPAAAVAAAALAVAALPALEGCSSQTKLQESDLTQLLTLLPGRYDNLAQAELETRSGAREAHVAVVLVIMHVFTPRLGHHVYYAQETAADDPRRVLGQKMYSFQLDEKRGIVQTLYQFTDPLRWRDGLSNKDLFTSVEAEDVQPEACQLLWSRKDDGWVAAHDSRVCPDRASAGAPAQMELTTGALTIGDYRFRKGR